MALLALFIWYVHYREQSVFLIDFKTFEPPESWKLSQEQLIDIMKAQNCFTDESIEFLGRMLQQSGVGPSTAWPPGIIRCLKGEKADRSAEAAREESKVK
jgi:3-ketoacyl-CoA synthase